MYDLFLVERDRGGHRFSCIPDWPQTTGPPASGTWGYKYVPPCLVCNLVLMPVNTFLHYLLIHYICLLVCACVCGGQRTTCKSQLSLHTVGPGGWTRVLSLDNKPLFPLSSVAGPTAGLSVAVGFCGLFSRPFIWHSGGLQLFTIVGNFNKDTKEEDSLWLRRTDWLGRTPSVF